MEIIAHRGTCFEHPENSMAAFDAAIRQGADRVELDVRLTFDGQVVVFHDATTERLTSRNLEVSTVTLNELREVSLSNGQAIPTLAEVCELTAGRVPLNVELKSANKRLAALVVEVLDRHGVGSETLISSFEQPLLRAVRRTGFQGRLGLLVGSRSFEVKQRLFEAWPLLVMRRLRLSDLVIHFKLAHPLLRSYLEKRRLGLFLWTAIADEDVSWLKRRRLYQRLERLGAEGAIVGRVTEARAVMGRAGSAEAAE